MSYFTSRAYSRELQNSIKCWDTATLPQKLHHLLQSPIISTSPIQTLETRQVIIPKNSPSQNVNKPLTETFGVLEMTALPPRVPQCREPIPELVVPEVAERAALVQAHHLHVHLGGDRSLQTRIGFHTHRSGSDSRSRPSAALITNISLGTKVKTKTRRSRDGFLLRGGIVSPRWRHVEHAVVGGKSLCRLPCWIYLLSRRFVGE